MTREQSLKAINDVSELLEQIFDYVPAGMFPRWIKWADAWITGKDRSFGAASGVMDAGADIWIGPEAFHALAQACFESVAAGVAAARGIDPAERIAEARRHLAEFEAAED